MATIITVHGTFASGPEEGRDWWQKGSEFEHDLRRWVEAEDGHLTLVPHTWDGANSELSRRTAGEDLARRLVQLAKHGRYCVVGHSHGGSIIALALMNLLRGDRSPFQQFSRWITVGTPFIRMDRRGVLYQRLTPVAKAAYLGSVTFAVLPSLWIIRLYLSHSLEHLGIPSQSLSSTLAMTALFLSQWALLHAFFRYREFRQPYHRPLDRTGVGASVTSKWLGLLHPADEAIAGLQNVAKVHIRLFPDRVFVGPLSAVAVVLSPVLLLLAIPVVFPGQAPGGGFFDAIPWMLAVLETLLERIIGKSNVYLRTAMLFSVAPLIACTFCILIVLISDAVAKRLSRISALAFDKITWHQLRQSAFGNDIVGEVGIDASSKAPWSTNEPPFLPAALSDELSAFSDRAAGQSVAKLRQAVQRLAFSEEGESKSNLLAEYLSWNELIHTAYFRVPRFRKLLCYAIAHSPGFRPSDHFKDDVDYALVAMWYDRVQTGR